MVKYDDDDNDDGNDGGRTAEYMRGEQEDLLFVFHSEVDDKDDDNDDYCVSKKYATLVKYSISCRLLTPLTQANI